MVLNLNKAGMVLFLLNEMLLGIATRKLIKNVGFIFVGVLACLGLIYSFFNFTFSINIYGVIIIIEKDRV